MDRIDRSLEDIIATEKLKKQRLAKNKQQPRVAATGRVSKLQSRRSNATARESPVFTETYKAMNTPIKEIFTAQYIPDFGRIKLVAYNPSAKVKTEDHRLFTKMSRSPSVMLSTGPDQSSSTHSRQGDFYRPSPSSRRHRNEDSRRSNSESAHTKHRNGSNSNTQSNGHDNAIEITGSRASSQRRDSRAPLPPVAIKMEEDSGDDMDVDDGQVKTERITPHAEFTIRGEGGPVTIEIENLDPGTTAEDVKVVCSRYGEIRSCICSDGFAQVTYARKAAGVAAMEGLNGKKADNDRILGVWMRKTPIVHTTPLPVATHVPTPIAGPMRVISKAVQGSITSVGTLYADQLAAAQAMLKVQQHRMAQLKLEEQRIEALRQQRDVNDTASGQ